MGSLRMSFTERRRRRLGFRRELERMESRSIVTPVGLTAFAVGSPPPRLPKSVAFMGITIAMV
jgi:hypothetical protein